MEIITRLARLRTRFDEELAGVFSRYDLSAADFAVIAALRRAGRPYRLRQSVLMEELGLTSGTVSVRINRLERKEIVTRSSSSEDARGTVVALTDKGLRLFDEVGPAHLRNEDVLLSALTDDERTQLTGLLRKLLVSFEHERAAAPLGMVLAPAHVARRLRTAVGLSDTPGLLVTGVTSGSPAQHAGLQEGDLLTAVDGVPLRSCMDLAERTLDAPDQPLDFTVLRGSDRLNVSVASAPDGDSRRSTSNDS
jgi:DNA-binding MarR family transcriptional regulator